MTTTETLSSVLKARNERGIRVAGEWRNLSKFRPPELPEGWRHGPARLRHEGIGSLPSLARGDRERRLPQPRPWACRHAPSPAPSLTPGRSCGPRTDECKRVRHPQLARLSASKAQGPAAVPRPDPM